MYFYYSNGLGDYLIINRNSVVLSEAHILATNVWSDNFGLPLSVHQR